jgi:hypothetical protein
MDNLLWWFWTCNTCQRRSDWGFPFRWAAVLNFRWHALRAHNQYTLDIDKDD